MKPVCTVRLLDEVFIQISGLKPEHNDFFYKRYGVLTDNYFFNPRFKLGQWDGKIRYYHSTGRTYVYLLEEILPIIVKFGYKINLVDQRSAIIQSPEQIDNNVFAHIMHLDTGKPIVLRDDQVQGVNALIQTGNGICLAGTGAGKTLMCAALVNSYSNLGLKTLTIVPDGSLIRQTKAEYINCQLDTGEYSGTTKTLEHQHIVSTWQALKNNPKLVSMFQLVIVDECHGLRGNVLQKILTEHAAKIPYRFGFTGTLPKSETERMSVHVAVGFVQHEISAMDLVDMGHLARLDINIVQLEEDLREEYEAFCKDDHPLSTPPTYTQFKDGYFPDFTSEKSYIHRKELRTEWIALYILTKREKTKGNVLCLVDSISLGRQLADLIPGAVFVNGQDVKSIKKRQVYYDMFKDRDDLVMIATIHIAGTGLSINRIFNLMFVDVGKSFTRVVQAIGRGLRKGHDKDYVDITDICSDLKYGKRHLANRVTYYKEQRYPHKKTKVDYKKMLELVDKQ